MSEKRFFLMRKFLRKDKFHDIICNRVMDSKETEKTLNRLYGKYSSLKMENEQLKQQLKKDNDVSDNTKQKLRDREKAEFENAKKDNIDVEEYEDAILQSASDKYWDYVYEYHVEADTVCDLLNEQDKTINELNKYCTACDDTLTTIQELTYKLLTIDFENAESKADYCRLLNELDNKDLSFIHDCIEAINKCDLMKMEELKREYGDSE